MATNPYGSQKAAEDAPAIQQPVSRPKLLVNNGLDEFWVHCAVCCAAPDGHYADGSVRWTGGTVYGVPGGEQNTVAYACRCAAGRSLHEHQQMPFFDEIPNLPQARWETTVYPVLMSRDQTPRLPSLVEREKFRDACFRQVKRQMAGEITADALQENIEALMTKLAPDRQADLSPDDLILSADLWRVYFPGQPTPGAMATNSGLRTPGS